MATPITRYAQNVAIEQIPFANFPGGGPMQALSSAAAGASNTFPIQFNDAGIEFAKVREVVSIYQMYGNEASSDIVNLYMAQPGSQVKPTGTICGSGIATTATVDVGDDDTTGFGLVSSGIAFGVQPSAATPLGASPTRYASAVNAATGQTNPIAFAGGDSLTDPYTIGATASEQPTSVGTLGGGVAGSWIQLRFRSIGSPVAGKVLVVRLTVLKP
jgi:hypothetical protein